MELAVVGIDALDPELLRRWRDDLDTLGRLVDAGGSGRIESSYPPLSIPAWPTLYTGKQGGKHGVYGFTRSEPDGYDRRPVNFDDVHAETLWEILDAAGLSCGVVNVPLTFPPSDLENGFVIAGWPSPAGGDICSDPAVLAELEDTLGGDYEVSPFPLTLEFDELDNRELYDRIEAGLEHHAEAFEHLLTTHDLDVFFGTFMAIDIASHNFAWDLDRLKQIYERQDELLGRLLDRLPKSTDVIVVSDHGHGAQSRHSFHVNEWLADEGYLTKTDEATGLLERLGLTQQRYVRVKNALGLDEPHSMLPGPLYEYLRSTVPRGDDGDGLDTSAVEWPATDVYSTEGMELFVNDRSKPAGAVDDPEKVREAVAADLRELTYPDEERPLFETVATRDELFEGPHVERAPDVVFVPRDMECNAPTAFNDGGVFSPERWGEHRQFGVLLTAGPAFDTVGATDCRLIDLLPTVLAHLDVAIPENVDGDVLSERFERDPEPSFRPSRDSHGGDSGSYDRSESEEVREQLQGLGYLE